MILAPEANIPVDAVDEPLGTVKVPESESLTNVIDLTVRDVGEKALLRDVIWPLCRGALVPLGVGDDAAVLSVPAGYNLLVSTDKIPTDLLAMQLGLMTWGEYGRYLAAVNISDIAAMGGIPTALLSTLALPSNFRVQHLKEFYAGFVAGGQEFGVPVVGGDLGENSTLCVSATILGIVETNCELRRSTAKPGDVVFTTGQLGGFSTALAYFISAKPNGFSLSNDYEKYLKDKLTNPQPRVSIGRSLSLSKVCTSCQDVTDGVGRTLHEIAVASQVSFDIIWDRIPVHPASQLVANFLAIPVEELIFGIGLDLELVGTLDRMALQTPLLKDPAISVIGDVLSGGKNTVMKDGSKNELSSKGWQHFVGDPLEIARRNYANRVG